MKNRKRRNPASPFESLDPVKVAELACYGLTQEQIADFFGISESGLRLKFLADTQLVEAYKKGRSEAISKVAKTVYDKAMVGNVACAFFYLKTQAGWRETDRHELTGADGGPIQHEDLDGARQRLADRADRIATRLGAAGVVGAIDPDGRRRRAG